MAEVQPIKRRKFRKIFTWVAVIIIILLIIGFWWKYYFEFGEGVKSGELNYVVKKGNIFKTYEGKLIQQGFKGSLQSNEFEFSIKSKHIFDVLELNSGKLFDIHYKEYHGVVPWRGNT